MGVLFRQIALKTQTKCTDMLINKWSNHTMKLTCSIHILNL